VDEDDEENGEELSQPDDNVQQPAPQGLVLPFPHDDHMFSQIMTSI